MSRIIKWGILGCGRIAEKFAKDMALIPDVQLVACASKDISKAQTFAEKFQVTHYYESYTSMLALAELDVIYIATTHNFHYANIVLCLEHGKHVLCEKPVCVTSSELDRVVTLAKDKGLFLMEAMWTAFLPAFQGLLQDINSGVIGEVRYLRADFGFFSAYDPKHRLFDPSLAGGCILDIGIYPLFAAVEILGKPTEIHTSKGHAPSGVEDECAIQLKYETGAHASLYTTLTCNTSNTLEIFGTQGSILVPSRFHELSQYRIVDQQGNVQDRVWEKLGFGYTHEIIHVSECLRKSMTESDIMTFAQSKALMELMQHAINH